MNYNAEEEVVYEYLRNKIYTVDIVIISNESLNEQLISQIFVPLTINLKEKFLGAELFDIEDKSYGIKIPLQSDFYQYCSTFNEVTIFLSQHSLNVGKAYGYGDVRNDSAISIVKYILGEK